jgi:Flp pilus assembly protein protease CpaA
MQSVFFPDPIFGWAFCAVLMALLAVAAYTDLRALTIPKPLTLSLLGLGLAANLVRGAWLGADGLAVWLFGQSGSWLGAVDGLLFSLAGFALAFAIFFILWIMSACGGGDLKLFAALAAWLGPELSIMVLIGTLVLVFVLSFARIVVRTSTHGVFAAVRSANAIKHGPGNRPIPKSRLISYSLPVAIATALVVFWVLRVDLRLAAPQENPNARAEIHAR